MSGGSFPRSFRLDRLLLAEEGPDLVHVLRGIDRDAFEICHTRLDPDPPVDDAQLLELLDFLQLRRRPRCELEQELAPVRIDADMLEVGGAGRRMPVSPVPEMWDRRSRKVNWELARVGHNLDDTRIHRLLRILDLANEGADANLGIVQQEFGSLVDHPRHDEGFVALHVDDDFSAGHFLCDHRDAVAPRAGLLRSEDALSAETSHYVCDPLVVGRDEDLPRGPPPGPPPPGEGPPPPPNLPLVLCLLVASGPDSFCPGGPQIPPRRPTTRG